MKSNRKLLVDLKLFEIYWKILLNTTEHKSRPTFFQKILWCSIRFSNGCLQTGFFLHKNCFWFRNKIWRYDKHHKIFLKRPPLIRTCLLLQDTFRYQRSSIAKETNFQLSPTVQERLKVACHTQTAPAATCMLLDWI